MAEVVVSVRGLSKKYGDLAAVDDVSFELTKGEVLALLGPNGAGKTTTVEILEGVRSPSSGEVSVLGRSIGDGDLGGLRARIGVLPQEFNALGRLTVRENLEFLAAMYESTVEVERLLNLLGIADASSVRLSRLSGGMKQRVGVAAALVNDPELIFLDEPTTGLDPEVRRSTWKVIADLRSQGKTILLTTHYMEEANALADRIVIMVKGKIAAMGPPADLLARYGGPKSMVFKKGGDAVFGTLRRFFDEVSMEGDDIVLPFSRIRDVQVATTALVERGIEVEFTLVSPTLEDVFLKLAGVKSAEGGDKV